MQRIAAKSSQAQAAYELVTSLQQRFVERLQQVSQRNSPNQQFAAIEWFRAQGRHGGGMRYVTDDKAVFNQASVNVSQVQYDADDAKALASATALSSIIHPHHPLAPSVHLHVSWTEMKNGHGYWRVMADLNPAIENVQHTARFKAALETAASQNLDNQQLAAAFAQGDRYFYIPALARHRGVCHFYLENFYTDDAKADTTLADYVMRQVIDTYAGLLGDASLETPISPEQARQQRDYHSLYCFQVLTLDRGTTSGLLVHDENDIGILGSLPRYVDKALMQSWQSQMPTPQHELLTSLVDCLPPLASVGSGSLIDDTVKKALATAVRAHYKQHPEALALQASGDVIPPTVANHR
ncbi:MAG: coproporphyrinogen III oxidase [Leucothrix sp.]